MVGFKEPSDMMYAPAWWHERYSAATQAAQWMCENWGCSFDRLQCRWATNWCQCNGWWWKRQLAIAPHLHDQLVGAPAGADSTIRDIRVLQDAHAVWSSDTVAQPLMRRPADGYSSSLQHLSARRSCWFLSARLSRRFSPNPSMSLSGIAPRRQIQDAVRSNHHIIALAASVHKARHRRISRELKTPAQSGNTSTHHAQNPNLDRISNLFNTETCRYRHAPGHPSRSHQLPSKDSTSLRDLSTTSSSRTNHWARYT